MTDIATLGLAVDSTGVKQANIELRNLSQTASASERAAEKLIAATNAAGKSSEEFSRRVKRNIDTLEFQRQQMARSAAEQERYIALRRAGVTAESAAGQAITANIRAIQAQRQAQEQAAEAAKVARTQAAGFAALAHRQATEAAAAAQRQAAESAALAQQQARAAKQKADDEARQVAQRRALALSVAADLNFERQQLTRNAAARERYSALRRAGVSESSAEGRAVLASLAALQAQRAAIEAGGKSLASIAAGSASARFGLGMLTRAFGPLAAVLATLSTPIAIWTAGMKAADFGEQAEQLGVTTDQLQAYRFAGAQAGIEVEQMDTALTRLAKTMGAAADGGKEQIELFDKLGVKILDANGELRPVAEVLPEVARGVLNIGSSSQRTATLMELFGRSGAKMTTVLEEIAKGNDSVIGKARAAGVVLDTEVIAAWDAVSDSLTRAKLAADSTFAKLGAPIATSALEAIEKLLKSINGVMDQINSKEGFWASVLDESRRNGRIGSGPNALRLETPEEAAARRRAELEKQLKDPRNAGREGMIQEDINRLNAQGIVAAQFYAEDAAAGGKFGPKAPAIAPLGDRNPTAKGSGTDPYAKAIESAREYILTKKAETEAIGKNALEAAKLKHEQELLNKAVSDGKTISEAQKATLQGLAQQMAEADNALATAKFMDDAKTRSEEFIAAQELEARSLFLTAEAAAKLKYETDLLNQARREGLELTPEKVAALQADAAAMASAEARTKALREAFEFAKSTTTEFFADIRAGLIEGQTIWEAFGNAAVNALTKISDKLFEMAANKLFESAFGGAGGGGGGGLLGGLFGGGASGTESGLFDGIMSLFNFFPTFAKGAAFRAGNVVPFAGGGVVSAPTYFPMSRGRTGVMGEAGPEAIMPLRRGADGRLGVEAANSNFQQNGRVDIYIHDATDMLNLTIDNRADVRIARASPGIVKSSTNQSRRQVMPEVDRHHSEQDGEWRGAA